MKQRVLAAGIALAVAFAALVPFTTSVMVAAASTQPAQDPAESKLVEEVKFTGNRRIPDDSMRLWVQTREGDPFSRDQVSRDLRTILAQGYFEDAKIFTEEGPRGGLVVIFEVKEYPVILDIDFPGLKSVSESDILEEWRKRSIGLSKESQFDPVKANRAAATIRELLAGKGRPDAKVVAETEEISPTAIALHFRTEEGDRVRIATIEFEGNQAFSDEELRDHMKIVKEAGLISGLTSKDIYDKRRLEYELDRVRLFYYDHGYLNVKFGEPVVEEAGRVGSGLPLVGGKDKGLKIIVPVEEGKVYRIGNVTIEGETVYAEEIIRAVLGLKEGEVVHFEKIRKGLYEDLKKLYGERGYINFEASFVPELRDDQGAGTEGVADLSFTFEEGKSFTIGRIEFKGNTYTRDKVLRREVLVNEGDPYNQRYFDLSILRLNQLGYFNEIKDTDADIRTNQRTNTVDIDLRVQEKGRQQIQFSGGASGIGGSFIGLQYSTNNLLGYGESLTVDIQAGSRSKQFVFGFTEPYLFDRPISAGFQIFYQNYQYFGGGVRIGESGFAPSTPSFFSGFGTSGEELFTQKTVGGSVSFSAPLTYFFSRSTLARFTRLGLSYTYRTSEVEDPAVNRDDDPTNNILVTYRQPGINQSTVTPTLSYNSLNASLDPTRGQSLLAGLSFSGGPLGGDVKTIQPTIEYKFFRPLKFISKDEEKPDVFGMRLLAGHIRAFGEPLDVNSLSFVNGTPIFARYFLGGEDTIRGYNVRSLSPVARVERFVTTTDVVATNISGDVLRVARPRNANRKTVAPSVIRTFTLDNSQLNAADQFTPIGADTQLLANFEYRVPIAGPVSIASFLDIGTAFNIVSYEDQFTNTEFVPSLLTPFGVTLNPRGQLATPDEIADAITPETPPGQLPPGFRPALIRGQRQDVTIYRLSEDLDSSITNYRYSVGLELRVQVPVVNVPFRLIYAYNPNARTTIVPGQVFIEERSNFFFSIGRTF
jgi:outer membrane protein insertion porin family